MTAEETPTAQLPTLGEPRELLGDAAVYTIGNILNRVFPFLLLPILTRYLSPAEYGTFVMFQVVVNLAQPFIGLNAEAAISRAFFDRDRAALGRYVSTALAVGAMASPVLLGAALLLGSWTRDLLALPAWWGMIAVLVAAGESVKAVLLALWQMHRRVRAYTTFTVVQTAVRFGACLLPLMFLQSRLEGLLEGYALSLLAFAIYAVWILTREGYLVRRYSRLDARDFLRYGVPLLPHRVAGWLEGMADRVIIASLLSLSAVGIYSAGYSVGAALALVQDAANRAWVPYFFAQLKRGNVRSNLQITQVVWVYSVAMLVLATVLALASPLTVLLFGGRFAGARVFVGWIAFAFAFNGIYKMFANFLFFSERTYILSSITIVTSLVSVGITYLLVLRIGVLGAGYAAVVSQILACAAVFLAAQRLFPMPWGRGLAALLRRSVASTPR